MKYSIITGFILALIIMSPSIISTSIKLKESDQIIETDLYQVSVPKNWILEIRHGHSIYFKQTNKELDGLEVIGELQILGYYPDQPISHLYPNHTETLDYQELSGFFTNTLLVKFRMTPPAASHEDWVKNLIYIYFLIKDENRAYTLWFNSDYVDEETALKIAKSFRYKK